IILMDMMMPEMNGYEATKKIKEHKEWKHIPIIAVTARVTEEDKKQCFEAGVSDFVSKPVDSDTLLKAISRWISTSS
ncbi:MAG: response regulator, partial [Chitinophagaceae bacterium]